MSETFENRPGGFSQDADKSVSVKAGKHEMADHVLEYIEAHNEAEIKKTMQESMCGHTANLVSGIETGFDEIE